MAHSQHYQNRKSRTRDSNEWQRDDGERRQNHSERTMLPGIGRSDRTGKHGALLLGPERLNWIECWRATRWMIAKPHTDAC
jgi:hypothetical protein